MRSFPLILRLGLIVGVLLATLSVGNTLLVRSSKAAIAIPSGPIENVSETRAYWTKERMQNATAESMPQVSTPSPTRPSTTTLAYSTNATDFPTSALPHSLYNQFPASFVGKILYYSPGQNKDTACSGTAITSNNQSVVATAGHCLYEFGAWSTKVLFCPQYYYGDTPGGCWSALQAWVTPSWFNDQHNFIQDFGMFTVQPMGGKTLTASIGAVGCYPNLPLSTLLSLTVMAYGYSVPAPFDGEQMIFASGNLTTITYSNLSGTMLHMSNNDMGRGASGGPWYVTYNGTLYLIGHFDLDSGSSPYLGGDEWLNLLNTAQNAPNA
jgi:hypothetical protein